MIGKTAGSHSLALLVPAESNEQTRKKDGPTDLKTILLYSPSLNFVGGVPVWVRVPVPSSPATSCPRVRFDLPYY